MIVKTGANYQADGGYIEASKAGNIITTSIDEKNYISKSDADANVSLYKTLVSKAPEISSNLYCVGLAASGQGYLPVGENIPGDSNLEKYAGANVAIYVNTSNITNPVLKAGSHNTILVKYSSTMGGIFTTGTDAVAIIGEGA